ncbi:MAG: hypothetical protein HYV09_25625 [Deltaproteobacteria bacterium]|nr:hypothetical protein [Deltaproteobacteria bacterium]
MSNVPLTRATPEQEVEHLLQLYDRDAAKIMSELQSQLSILANRAQTLLSLAGITITVTGFSGANIARTGRVGASLLVLGLVLVLVAAAIAMNGILRVRWTTSLPPCSLAESVRAAIDVRDLKTRNFDLAMTLLVVGLTLYVSSVALLLLGNLP